jgi:O-antigen/teichoic acid export membrane protein
MPVAQGSMSIDRAARPLHGLAELWHHGQWALASQVVASSANFATSVILIRHLGIEEFGRFAICFLLMMLSRNFLNAVLLAPMSTITPKLSSSAKPAYSGFLAANAVVFSIASSLLLVLVSVPAGWLINAPWLPALALPLAAANLAANGADYLRRYHFVKGLPAAGFLVDLVRNGVQIGLLLALLLAAPELGSASAALVVMAAGGVVGVIAGGWFHGRLAWSWRLSAAVWPRYWNFIKWTTPGFVLDAIQHNAPLFIGNAFLGESAIGVVRAMQQLANVLNLPLNSLQQMAPSMAAAAYKSGGRAALNRFLVKTTCSGTLMLLAIALLGLGASEFLFRQVFSEIAAMPVLLAYFLVNLVILLRLPLLLHAQSIEKLQPTTLSSLLGAICAVAASLALVGTLGALAVPVAALVALAVNHCVLIAVHQAGAR